MSPLFPSRWLSAFSRKAPRPMSKRQRRRMHRPWIEPLEDRTLLTASLTIDGAGLLTFQGSSIGANVGLALSAGTYTITDSGETITVSGAGSGSFTGGGTGTVQGPANSVSAI